MINEKLSEIDGFIEYIAKPSTININKDFVFDHVIYQFVKKIKSVRDNCKYNDDQTFELASLSIPLIVDFLHKINKNWLIAMMLYVNKDDKNDSYEDNT